MKLKMKRNLSLSLNNSDFRNNTTLTILTYLSILYFNLEEICIDISRSFFKILDDCDLRWAKWVLTDLSILCCLVIYEKVKSLSLKVDRLCFIKCLFKKNNWMQDPRPPFQQNFSRLSFFCERQKEKTHCYSNFMRTMMDIIWSLLSLREEGDYCEAPCAYRVRKMSAKRYHFAPPPPTCQKWKFGSFKSSWTSDFKVSLYSPPPPPQKKEICRFETFKSSLTSDFKVPLYPSPGNEEMKSMQILNFQVKLNFRIPSTTVPPAPFQKLKVCRFGTFKSGWTFGLQISKYHFTHPPPKKNEASLLISDLHRDASFPSRRSESVSTAI